MYRHTCINMSNKISVPYWEGLLYKKVSMAETVVGLFAAYIRAPGGWVGGWVVVGWGSESSARIVGTYLWESTFSLTGSFVVVNYSHVKDHHHHSPNVSVTVAFGSILFMMSYVCV